MKYIISGLVYFLVLNLAVFLGTTSEGYDTFFWRYLVANIYAVPVSLFVYFLIHMYTKKDK